MSREFEDAVTSPDSDPYAGEAYSDDEIYSASESDTLDLRREVLAQIGLLRSIRKHIFHSNGQPRPDFDMADIKGYLSSSTQLLQMLQKFEEALRTDQDMRRIESAVALAMEDAPCPEFVEQLKHYLTHD